MQLKPVLALAVPLPEQKTIYPPPFAALVQGRNKRKLGDFFGLTRFGVNLTQLAPGAVSALYHYHAKQDEFIFIMEGTPTLILDGQEFVLNPGDCMGFKAGTGLAHQLLNRSQHPVTYLEAGDRTQDDEVEYPNDNLKATMMANGQWQLTHKDGKPY